MRALSRKLHELERRMQPRVARRAGSGRTYAIAERMGESGPVTVYRVWQRGEPPPEMFTCSGMPEAESYARARGWALLAITYEGGTNPDTRPWALPWGAT